MPDKQQVNQMLRVRKVMHPVSPREDSQIKAIRIRSKIQIKTGRRINLVLSRISKSLTLRSKISRSRMLRNRISRVRKIKVSVRIIQTRISLSRIIRILIRHSGQIIHSRINLGHRVRNKMLLLLLNLLLIRNRTEQIEFLVNHDRINRQINNG